MQHAETEYLGVLDEDMKMAMLEMFKPEERVRGLPPEERLRGLSEEELDRLRELLERKRDG